MERCRLLCTKGQAKFFKSLKQSLQSHFEHTVVFGGNSNIAFDLSLDKTVQGKLKPKHPPKQSLRIAQLLHSLGLVDIWREPNPHNKDYTHFSATYQDCPHLPAVHLYPYCRDFQYQRHSPIRSLHHDIIYQTFLKGQGPIQMATQ